MWDERYSDDKYAYGTEPNEFLVEAARHLPERGDVLCLAEGEGRNAVWLAEQGYTVTAVDASAVGLAKAARLAESRGVQVNTLHIDLADYPLGENRWDAIVSIFGHLPPPIRHRVHAQVAKALRPTGVMILEAYTPEQLKHGTGGPKDASFMMTVDGLRQEFAGLDVLEACEKERPVVEGIYHHGTGAVVQFVGRRPAA